jgi:hypothetical protein
MKEFNKVFEQLMEKFDPLAARNKYRQQQDEKARKEISSRARSHVWGLDDMINIKVQMPENTDLEIITYERASTGDLYGLAFQGRANKPIWAFRFRKKADRDKRVASTIESRKAHLDQKAKEREARKNYQHKLQVGDILDASWGYNQTNVNFYQVVELKGKMVVVREINSKVVKEDPYWQEVMPVKDSFKGGPIKKKPNTHDGIKINSSIYATPWDGLPSGESGPYGGH